MKTTKQAAFTRRIVAAFVGAVLFLGALSGIFLRFPVAHAEEGDSARLMKLEEVDAWDTDGYKIEKKSGTYSTDADGDGTEEAYEYDYELTISDEIWFVNDKTLAINNVSSRPLKLNISTSDGISFLDNQFFNHTSWFQVSSTNAEISSLKIRKVSSYPNLVYLNAEQTVGQAVLTVTLNVTLSAEDIEGYESLGYTEGQTINETLRILYTCVKKENIPFTFTGAAKDLNGNGNSVWLYGVNIPEANEEWTKAEVAGGLFNEFYSNIYYLEGNEDGTAKELTEANLAGSDFKTILTNTAVDALKFQIEVRDDHMEIKKLVRQFEGDNDGTAVSFEEGDAIYLKKGLYYLGKDGNTEWCLYEQGFSFFELSRDQQFIYLGEEKGWSADELGYSISFETNKASADVGDTVTLTPILSGGASLPADQKVIVWTSSDETVATVENGVVTGVAAGTAVITATTGTGDYATVTVTVVPSTIITKITLNATSVSLNINGTREVKATVTGGSAADLTVTWNSSDETVATVDQNGKITAIAAGTATITATAADGKTATLTVTVRAGAVDKPDDSTSSDDATSSGVTSDSGNSDAGSSASEGNSTEEGGCGSSITSALFVSIAVLFAACIIVSARKRKE